MIDKEIIGGLISALGVIMAALIGKIRRKSNKTDSKNEGGITIQQKVKGNSNTQIGIQNNFKNGEGGVTRDDSSN